jgi:hypothetical protein
MKRKLRGLALFMLAALMLPLPVSASPRATGQYYSYNYDYWGESRESPNPYTASKVLTGAGIGIGNFRNPQGVFVQGGSVYIVDTGNNRIVELDANYELVREITEFTLDGQLSAFNRPNDVFVTENGDFYVADTDNQRVVHFDKDLNAVKVITKPAEALMDAIGEFLPTKLVVDNADRIFLIARNVNKGIMEFDSTGAFTGYVGANKVSFNVIDMVWKIFSTQAQRDQMALFVPTEYNNISLDHKGFMYTTCSSIPEEDLIEVATTEQDTNILTTLLGIGTSSNVEPIRRLNAMGADILIRNGWVMPLGDWQWSTAEDGVDATGPSRFIDSTSNEHDTYFALDRTRGRIFGYDFQGNLLFVFGGLGNKAGYFQYPTAIEHFNESLLVMDSTAASLTVFTPTEYGNLIHGALDEYVQGNYERSADMWRQVLVYNTNYDLAYIGLGRALLRQERYEEAMYYFKLKYDTVNYSKAYQQYRKQVVEDNIGFLITGVFALIILWNVYKQVKRFRKGASGHGAKETA